MTTPPTTFADPIAAYFAWRAKLAPADQVREDYLITDALPLIADVVKQFVDPDIRKIMVVGGIADSMFDGAIDTAVSKAIAVLVPKTA